MNKTKLQVIASTMPIPENAGEVKEALERHINTMKTPHEQCADEIMRLKIVNRIFRRDSIKKIIEKILSKHFIQSQASEALKLPPKEAAKPTGKQYDSVEALCKDYGINLQPPTSTTSLDEVAKKWSKHWYSTSDLRLSDEIKQAILEYNASLIAEVEALRDKLGRNTITSFWVDSYYAVKAERNNARVENGKLRTQIATAEQTGYERGVREAASKVDDITWGDAKDELSQAILNLLNKKGTE